jgi:hypothetical protein
MRFAAAIVALMLLAAPSARADATAPMTTRAASHEARVSHDEITWRSLYVGNAYYPGSGMTLLLDLAEPIVASLDAAGSPGVTPIVDGGAIVGFAIDADHVPSWSDGVALVLHAPRTGASEALLAPPLARGDVTSRIVVSGDDDLRFEPTAPQLERHVGYWAAASSREGERRACDEAIGERARLRLDEIPIYVTGAEASHGIRGHFTTSSERARPGIFFAAVLFVLVASGLGLAHLRLSGRARIEQAEAVLREEYGDSWGKPG